MSDTRTIGGAITAASDTLTLQQLPSASLHHEVVVRVIGEQWAGGTLTEHTALEYVLRPADVIGKAIALQFWPLDWAADTGHKVAVKGNVRPAISICTRGLPRWSWGTGPSRRRRCSTTATISRSR